MTTLHEAAQQALEALEMWVEGPFDSSTRKGAQTRTSVAITALRTALAEPEQEPVAYIHRQGNHWEVSERFLYDDEKARGWTEEPLYTHPAPQPVELTDEEILEINRKLDAVCALGEASIGASDFLVIARAVIEAYQRKQEGKA
jgi:hypothetical protein